MVVPITPTRSMTDAFNRAPGPATGWYAWTTMRDRYIKDTSPDPDVVAHHTVPKDAPYSPAQLAWIKENNNL